ncbi:MAG: cytochrome c [Anaerolineales bacterium]|jgi:mono/diheme cytochrome c family protein
MAEVLLLGLLHEATPSAETIDQLRQLGVPDEKITVMSGMPYRAEMLGRPRSRGKLMRYSLGGALGGLTLGVFLTAVIFLLYPLVQGGQPIIPIPPSLIVLFETTMLGTMWATFLGLLLENRFPIFKSQLYDPRITEGHIGVLAQVDESIADQAEKILVDNGAHHMNRGDPSQPADTGHRLFWSGAVAGLAILTAVALLIAFDVTKINFPTNMAEQNSIAYVEGPRLAAPEQAVPVQGPVLIAGQPASQSVPASNDSVQRGQVLFGIICAVCHGKAGDGNSPLSGFFSPHPADLTSESIQSLSDESIYLVITEGRALMPSMAENLGPEERWDVINYVRTLKK